MGEDVMTAKYYTADGHEIVRDGVYRNPLGYKFVCLGFKSPGQLFPVVGYLISDDGKEDSDMYEPASLTLWREPAEQVEVWEVVALDNGYDNAILYWSYNGESAARAAAGQHKKVLTIRLKETITVGGV